MRIFCLTLILFISCQSVIYSADVTPKDRVSDELVKYQPRTFIFVEPAPEDSMASVKTATIESYQSRMAFKQKLEVDKEKNASSIRKYEEWSGDLADLVRKIDEGFFTDPFKAREELHAITDKYMPGDYQ